MKRTPIPWTFSHRNSRHDGIVLTTVMIGHARLGHSYPPELLLHNSAQRKS